MADSADLSVGEVEQPCEKGGPQAEAGRASARPLASEKGGPVAEKEGPLAGVASMADTKPACGRFWHRGAGRVVWQRSLGVLAPETFGEHWLCGLDALAGPG